MSLKLRTTSTMLAAAATVAAAALPANAIEFQYTQGITNVHAGLYGNSSFVHGPAFSFMQPMQSLTFVDNSGILLAALGNAGAAETARRQAEERAIDRGVKVGERYSYSWNEVPLREGAVSYLRYTWGSGSGASIATDGTTFTGGTLPSSVTGFDFGAPLGIWDTGFVPLGFSLAAQWYTYQVSGLTPTAGSGAVWGKSTERTAIRMPVTMSTAFNVLPSLYIRPAVSYDLLSGLGALLGSQGHGFLYELSAEYELISFLPIHASYVFANTPTSESALDASMVMAGASLRF
ncbi:hypothetical protein D3C72_171100 [compost metagenome]